jgi:hypothetical protein
MLAELVFFAAEIAAYLVLVLRRPEPLGAGRGSGLLGLAAALVTGGVYLYSRLDNQPRPSAFTHLTPSMVTLFSGATVGIVLAAVFVPIAAGALAALPGAIRRSGIEQWLPTGAAEAMWAALLTGPTMFVVCLLTIRRAAIVVTFLIMHGCFLPDRPGMLTGEGMTEGRIDTAP